MKYIIIFVSIFMVAFKVLATEKNSSKVPSKVEILKNQLILLEKKLTLDGKKFPTLTNGAIFFGNRKISHSNNIVDEFRSQNGLAEVLTPNFTYPSYSVFIYDKNNKKLIPVSTTLLSQNGQRLIGKEYQHDISSELFKVVELGKEICGTKLKSPQQSIPGTKKSPDKVDYFHDYCAKPIFSPLEPKKVIGVYFVSTYETKIVTRKNNIIFPTPVKTEPVKTVN